MTKRLLIVVALFATSAVGVSLNALPTPAQFEMEGNAVVDGGNGGDDWANTVPPPPGAGSEALVSTFVADGSGNATIFTGGGSKDINDLTQWTWKDQLGGLPDKDNITNAYAAAYDNNGELTVYFGADRFATAGDAELGFWFFHRQVNAVMVGNTGKFVGADGQLASHTLGDILVLANFSNGGSSVQIQVFQWNGSGLTQVANTANAKCGSNDNPNVCAITNEDNTVAPWAYTPKAGVAGTFPAVSFFEGAINLSAFIDTSVGGCFSSFMAETRSSTSQTATLKDFALGSFNTCDLDIAKSCPTVVYDPGTNLLNYTSSIVVTNKGFGTVYDVTMTDTPSAPATPSTQTLASLANGASHTFTHVFSLTPGLQTPNPPSNTATVTAAIVPNGAQVVDGGSASATCPSVSFDAALSIEKQCTAGLEVVNNQLVVVVNITGQVCNIPGADGAIPEAINGVVVSDDPNFSGGNINLGTLAVNECKPYSAKFYPSSLIGGSPNANDQTFTDTAAVTGTGGVSGNTRQNTASATCPLCPPHQ